MSADLQSRFSQTEKSAKKLQLLFDNLRSKPTGDTRSVGYRVDQLADKFFSRAPGDFFERTSLETMETITAEVQQFIEIFRTKQSAFTAQLQNPKDAPREHYSTLLLAISDRPFVVDSLLEFFRINQIAVHVLLHPILTLPDGLNYSVIYAEIDKIVDQERLTNTLSMIEIILKDLVSVTDDFSPMLSRVESAAQHIENGNGYAEYSDTERVEVADLLRWIGEGGFVLLGFREWIVDPKTFGGNLDSLCVQSDSDLGLFRSSNPLFVEGLKEATLDAKYVIENNCLFHFSKVLLESTLHRRSRKDMVTVRIPSADGKSLRIQSILGLFTSKAISQEISAIPILRQKLRTILALDGLLPNSYDYKEVVSTLDTIPKSELFQYDTETIRDDVSLILGIQQRSETRVSVHVDALRRFVSVMVVMPRERFAGGIRHKIQSFLEQELGAREGSAEYRLAVADSPLLRIHFFIPNPSYRAVTLDGNRIHDRISELTRTWDDRFAAELRSTFTWERASRLARTYQRILPEQYKAATTPEQACTDITYLENLSADSDISLALRPHGIGQSEDTYDLSIYKRGTRLTLSSLVPYLENAGFDISSEDVTLLGDTSSDKQLTIYTLHVHPRAGHVIDLTLAKTVLLPGLREVFLGRAENDPLNALLLSPGLSISEIAILRALQRYLWQLKVFASKQYLFRALTINPDLARTIVDYFVTRFDPDQYSYSTGEREQALKAIGERFQQELRRVPSIVHDRILRALLNIVTATVRTNFFQGHDDLRVVLKIDCRQIKEMPEPRPMYETFVAAPDFEGVHLRGGKVARGGIRWSDRHEDYRTEVLGLVKTQMVKNSIIIPVGAKGGFIVKQIAQGDMSQAELVELCYRKFITSLLEIVDNRVGGEIAHPARCVIYDDADPYLVVAADKGTATFSDTANSIAVDSFNFWLGDAFASGGTYGYDHKKLAITARGTWECVCRHFREIGIDPDAHTFSVAGIGDMSGDVFGNGLLLSKNAKLLAAFNHKHIFLDPDPDPLLSFEERSRLFALPRSQWSDYDRSLLSAGGGIYDRNEKEIVIGPEAARVLGIHEGTISGSELIRNILRAPVDLLWNGGIGTYVKASFEEDIYVGDPSNDDVRVAARDLRTKVIGEGGNLGVTQLGRIEYSKVGGHINVDAIDNSGGVDISDMEVNLKILLRSPMERGELTFTERNKLLETYSAQVCEKVLERNRSQSKILSLGVLRSRKNLGYYKEVITQLEKEGFLKRENEYLPDDETLEKRSLLKAGLTRPELAILIGYMKIYLYNRIIQSDIPDGPSAEPILLRYFPAQIVERFRNDVMQHPLRREIIATQISNTLVERMGSTFIFKTASETGVPAPQIILAFLAADEIIGGERLIRELEIIDRPHATRNYHRALLSVSHAIDGLTRWILERRYQRDEISGFVQAYRKAFSELHASTEEFLQYDDIGRYRESLKRLEESGCPHEVSQRVAGLAFASAYMDIIDIALRTGRDLVTIGKLYARLAVELDITRLLEQTTDIDPSDWWESLALRKLSSEIRASIGKITERALKESSAISADNVQDFLVNRAESLERLRKSAREFQGRPLTVPALLVISNQLHALSA